MIDNIKHLIEDSNNIYIASHVQPDGDNIGSLLALRAALKQINNNVNIVKVDTIPEDFLFLEDIKYIKKIDTRENIDLFISLDSSDLERLGLAKKLALSSNKIINIDHHITNENFGDINIVKSNASSTGEIVYELIKKLGLDIDKKIATYLYVAISSDTGNFMYDNTSSNTHLIVADLLNKGIDLNNIIVHLYQSKSLKKTNLFIKALNSLSITSNGKLGIVKVTQEMLNECNASMEDSHGIVSFVRDISNIEVACILKEFDTNEIKVSLRSKLYADVSRVCVEFNGGGHKKAAGCTIYDTIDNAEKKIVNQINQII